MEFVEDLLDALQPILGGYPALIGIAILMALGVVKKLVKLAIFAGALAVIWLALQQFGVNII